MTTTSPRIQRMRILLTWASVTVSVFVLCAIVASGACIAYGRLYENRMFPGLRVLNIRLDGLTQQEAQKAVQDAVDAALAKGLRFRYHGREVVIDATTVSTDPDASRDLVRYDVENAIAAAHGMGRGGGWKQDAAERLRLRVVPLSIPVKVAIDAPGITDAVHTSFQKDLQAPLDAHLVINASSTPFAIHVSAESKGAELVVAPAIATVQNQADQLAFQVIELSDRLVTPSVRKDQLEPLIPRVEDFLRRPNLSFTYQSKLLFVPTSTLASWVSVTGTGAGASFEVALDPTAFASGIRALAQGIEHEGKNGGLVVKDGKVQSFVAGEDRVTVDTDAMYAAVQSGWPATSTFPLLVKTVPATLVGEDPERLGIRELLGVGTSNFAGSPVNRRKNIAHGVALVNGTIIPPGEVFSLIKTLGAIDGEHNWLPELVIKGNETKPEFGGGLCQIGTTVFRAALYSGLPIVERANHSYRVRYYEPAGTDATIYDPKPDLRFQNDTTKPIFINGYIKGDSVYFEFWGTKDGRVADVGTSHVYNITPPAPMKLVETLDLPPGKKKCTETAHAGADADFTYTVTTGSGEVKKVVFHSHYRPWQAVCLVGVDKLSKTPEGSADEVISSPDQPAPVSASTSSTTSKK